MWQEGIVEIGGIRYRFCAKVYDEGSVFGIDGGRVSKLWIARIVSGEETVVCSYDRGWDINPDAAGASVVYCTVMNRLLGLE